ncbi:MAG: hypothetical protein K2M63_06890, partial [Muribaculaceae bacterium]|nr:hypothetical protein [Muribaculaceae bacterium]
MKNKFKNKWGIKLAVLSFLLTAAPALCTVQDSPEMSPEAQIIADAEDTTQTTPIKKVLFIGDSMTGWMAERFNAYADNNDFEVATVVWDGSTISKWANSPNLKNIIQEQEPDAIILSLGMNELFERNPEKQLTESVEKLKESFGDIPFLWIGPPSWPGHSEGETLNTWLEEQL